jgi:MFS family permease
LENKSAIKLSILLASSLTVMSGATISPSLPQMARVFADTPHAEFLSKLIVTVPALAVALSAPFAGKIVDRFGRLRLLFACLVIYAIGGTSGLYLNDIYAILVGRLVLGIGVAGTMTVSVTLIGDYFVGKEREQFMGFQGAFMSFGGVIFVGTGGLLADIQWRYPFMLYFFSLFVLAMAVLYLFEPPRTRPLTGDAQIPVRFSRKHWMLFGTGFLVMVIFYMVPVQIPFLLKSIGVEKNALAGLAIVCLTACGTITSLLYKRIRTRMSFPSVYVLMCTFLALGFAVVSIAHTYPIVLIGMALSGMGGGLFMANSSIWLLHVTDPVVRGRSVGMLTMFIFIGQFVSPIVVEGLKTFMSLEASFFSAAMVLVALGGGYLWMALRRG